MMPIKFKETE